MSEDAINPHAVPEPSEEADFVEIDLSRKPAGVLGYSSYQETQTEIVFRLGVARPPGLVFHLFTLVLSVATYWFWRIPFGEDLLAYSVWPVWFVLIMRWFWVAGRWTIAPSHTRESSHWANWAVFPVLAFLCIAGVYHDVPMRLGFAASRSQLTAIATGASTARTTGVYRVNSMETQPGGVILYVGHRATIGLSETAFAYFPSGSPVSARDGEFIPLGGGWYTFSVYDDW